MQITKEKIIKAIPILIILFVFTLNIVRCFFGVDLGDETLYIALPRRFLMGDPMFLTDWSSQQSFAFVQLPLVALYLAVNGGTYGIILFMRLAFTICQLMVVLYSFFKLKKYISILGALVASLLLFYAPYYIHTFSYNNHLVLFLPVAFLLLIDLNSSKTKYLKCVLSGLLVGFSVLSYITTVLLIPLFLVYLVFLVKSKEKWASNSLKVVAMFAVGGLIVLASFLLYISFNSSISNIIESFIILANGRVTASGSFSHKLFHGISTVIGGKKICLAIVVLMILAAVLSYLKPSKIKTIINIVCVAVSATYVVYKFAHGLRFTPVTYFPYNFYPLILAAFGPMIFFICGRKYHVSIFLYFIGALGFLITSYSSINPLDDCAYPLIFSVIAMIIYVSHTFSLRKENVHLGIVKLSYVLMSAVTCLFVFMGFYGSYNDLPITQLTSYVKEGPAAGLYTNYSRATAYTDLNKVFEEYLPDDGRLVCIPETALVYLYKNVTPGTPDLCGVALSDEKFGLYAKGNPDRQPTIIFLCTGYEDLFSGYLPNRMNETGYTKRITKLGTFFYLNK